jgi:maltose-binding protein MalE
MDTIWLRCKRYLARPVVGIALFHLLSAALFTSSCTPPDGRVRIRIWHQKNDAERSFFEEAVAKYNASHSDRVVEVLYKETEELRNLFIVASVGGQGPELVYGPSDNLSVFALTGSIAPITTVLDAAYLGQFDASGVIRWNDEAWLVGDQVGNHLTLVYNKALMPQPPETTDEMIAMLQTLTSDDDGDGRMDRYGLTWNYTEPFFFIPFLTGFGGWMIDDAGRPTLNTEATVKAIQFVLDLRDRYQVIPRESDYNIAETLFKEGRAASIINGPWAWAGYGDAGIDYGLARIPLMSETGLWSAPVISSKGYSVNANLEDDLKPYVRDLLVYLTDASMQRQMAERLSAIPTLASVRADSVVMANPILRASLRQVEVGPAAWAPGVGRDAWAVSARDERSDIRRGGRPPDAG